MIGLVYTDYTDPKVSDVFHRAACDAFREVAVKHPRHVLVATDPFVSKGEMFHVFSAAHFIFYWGHGEIIKGRPVLLGSTKEHQLDLLTIGSSNVNTFAYLDGCRVGRAVDPRSFPSGLVVCPIDCVSYATSVGMGCSMIRELFGYGRTFSHAFHAAVQLEGIESSYRLVGLGKDNFINAPKEVRLSILTTFFDLLHIWDRQNDGKA